MSYDTNPMEVGENTTLSEAEEALAHNSEIIQEAAIVAEVAREERVRLETSDEGTVPDLPKAKGSTEAGVYGDVVFAAATGGSATAELLQMGAKVISEGLDTNNLGGMERPVSSASSSSGVTRDILGQKVRCIKTEPMNDIFARSSAAGGFMSGEDKVKGIQTTADAITQLKSIEQAQLGLKAQAALHAGNAINHKAQLGAEKHQALQQGISPSGMTQPHQVRAATYKKDMMPKGPSHMSDEETGTVET